MKNLIQKLFGRKELVAIPSPEVKTAQELKPKEGYNSPRPKLTSEETLEIAKKSKYISCILDQTHTESKLVGIFDNNITIEFTKLISDYGYPLSFCLSIVCNATYIASKKIKKDDNDFNAFQEAYTNAEKNWEYNRRNNTNLLETQLGVERAKEILKQSRGEK